MDLSEHDLQALLQQHLQDKLQRDLRYLNPQPTASGTFGASSGGNGPRREAPRSRFDAQKEADRLQHRIYQLRDRLTHDIFGRDSESLADDFIARFDLPIEKRSPEYYQVLRRILHLEIEYHAILMERISGNHSGG